MTNKLGYWPLLSEIVQEEATDEEIGECEERQKLVEDCNLYHNLWNSLLQDSKKKVKPKVDLGDEYTITDQEREGVFYIGSKKIDLVNFRLFLYC